jgi:predicted O-methyltransferase YrrM
MIRTKYHSFEEYQKLEHAKGVEGQSATQLMRMYRIATEQTTPTILELGAARGASTTLFLQASEENDGRLVSVDIKDCSDISQSSRWTFVQSDSTDVDFILSKAPHLRDGIDILYIDSLHTKSHVEKELTGWYPFMKKGSHVFFDDVDSNPYRKGQRKDNFRAEVEWDRIREYVEAFFYSNEDDFYMDTMFGSTGLAHLYKLCPMGTTPREARPVIHRRENILDMLRYSPRSLLSSLKRMTFGR